MPQSNKPRVSGAIFQNTSGRGPEYTGVIEIDGVKTQLAFWPKVSQGGKNYLQISEDRKRPQGSPAPQQPGGFRPGGGSLIKPSANKPNSDMDDDIPF